MDLSKYEKKNLMDIPYSPHFNSLALGKLEMLDKNFQANHSTWANVDPVLCHHMAPLGHNKFLKYLSLDVVATDWCSDEYFLYECS